MFPWNDVVFTSFAIGDGLYYPTKTPKLEHRRAWRERRELVELRNRGNQARAAFELARQSVNSLPTPVQNLKEWTGVVGTAAIEERCRKARRGRAATATVAFCRAALGSANIAGSSARRTVAGSSPRADSPRDHQFGVSVFLLPSVILDSSNSAPIVRQSHQLGRLMSLFKPIAVSVAVVALPAPSCRCPGRPPPRRQRPASFLPNYAPGLHGLGAAFCLWCDTRQFPE